MQLYQIMTRFLRTRFATGLALLLSFLMILPPPALAGISAEKKAAPALKEISKKAPMSGKTKATPAPFAQNQAPARRGQVANINQNQCNRLKTAVTQACCALGDNIAHPELDNQLQVEVRNVRDCDNNQMIEINCVPRDVVLNERIPVGGAVNLNENDNPECVASQRAYEQFGCGQRGLQINCAEASAGGRVNGYPTCESIDEFLAGFHDGDQCHPIPDRYYDPLVDNAVVFGDDVLETEPDELQFEAFSDDDAAQAGPEAEPIEDVVPEDTWNLPAHPFRLEIPGNFFRYFITRAAFRPAINAMDNAADGIHCDDDDLRCTINVIKASGAQGIVDQMDDNVRNFHLTTQATRKGFSITTIEAGVPGVITAKWTGNIFIQPYRGRNMVVDLGSNSHIPFIPLHDPKDANGYETHLSTLDGNAHYLDRTWIATNLPADLCTELLDKELPVKNKKIPVNGEYITYQQPYKCSCPGARNENYCVIDPYPRDEMFDELRVNNLQAGGARVHEAYCSDPLWVETSEVNVEANPPLRRTLDTFYANSDINLDALANDVRLFGCTGRQLTLDPQFNNHEVPEGAPNLIEGQAIASAAGISFDGLIQPGGIEATMEKGTHSVWIELEFHTSLEEWLKKRWYTWLLGFFLKWIMKLWSAILSVFVTGLLHVATTPLGNTAYVILEDMGFEVQGLLSHHEVERRIQGHNNPVPFDEVGFELRRITSTKPMADAKAIDFRTELPACSLDGFDRIDGPGDFIRKFLRLVVGCPYQAFEEMVELVMSPITAFILDIVDYLTDFSQILIDTLNDPLIRNVNHMQSDHQLANLIHSSTNSILFDPLHLLNNAREGLIDKDMAFMMNSLCSASIQPEITCCMAHLFGGTLVDPVDGRTDITRMGVKTHYRSYQDFENLELDQGLPPVRYCTAGDNPSGDPALEYSDEDLGLLTDLHEIDVSSREIQTQDGRENLPLNWQSQCGFHVDFEFSAATRVQKIQVRAIPTRRTNLLMNEVFFCKDNQDCNPTLDDAAIRQRADLATCSMAADLWYQEVAHGQGASPLQNVLLSALQERPFYLERLFNEIQGQIGCNLMPPYQEFRDYLTDCHEELTEAGFEISATPPGTLPWTEGAIDWDAQSQHLEVELDRQNNFQFGD